MQAFAYGWATRAAASKATRSSSRYEFTVHDPATYTQPWTAAVELDSKPGYEIYEDACHEGNLGSESMLSVGCAEERAAAAPWAGE